MNLDHIWLDVIEFEILWKKMVKDKHTSSVPFQVQEDNLDNCFSGYNCRLWILVIGSNPVNSRKKQREFEVL